VQVAHNELGEFLRSRRASLPPEPDAGEGGERRRVSGLRREEVAVRAQISADYYTRLEQGRETGPSPQVLHALRRALELGPDLAVHLFRLAGLTLDLGDAAPRDVVEPGLARLLDRWTTPAFVMGRSYDVLARNTAAESLFAPLARSENLLAGMFLDPAGRELYADWEEAAENLVRGFRFESARAPDDPAILAALSELRAGSADFVRMWETHDVQAQRHSTKRFRHPVVGLLTVDTHVFDVRYAPGLQLIVYDAPDGTASSDALARLLPSA
jgi:transcriptional regulator with XRE-family HTH domain